jgi:hypothetical protein
MEVVRDIKTVTDVIWELRSIGTSLIMLSGRMQQCPFMGDAPWPELFTEAGSDRQRLDAALAAYKRINAPAEVTIRPADEHQLDIEDGAASFEAKNRMGAA